MPSSTLLIRDTICVLEDGIQLISGLSDDQFQETYTFSKSGIGPHFRHVYDHYVSFLNGVKGCQVSYELRGRDVSIETTVSVAVSHFEELILTLQTLSDDDANTVLQLDTVHDDESYNIGTTLGRELQFLLSHTLHHFAIIRMMVVSLSVPVSEYFGMAPSTKRYLRTTTS